MIKFDTKNNLLIIEINNRDEKLDFPNVESVVENAIIDLSHLQCSLPETSMLVEEVLEKCKRHGIQKWCFVTRPSLLSPIREYLRVLARIENVAFFNHLSAAIRYFSFSSES